ncbi:hypothetical protein ACLOJK_008803 [Asimina triloba]
MWHLMCVESDIKIESQAHTESSQQKHKDIVADFGDLVCCVDTLKDSQLKEATNLKQSHIAMKEDIHGSWAVKESRFLGTATTIVYMTLAFGFLSFLEEVYVHHFTWTAGASKFGAPPSPQGAPMAPDFISFRQPFSSRRPATSSIQRSSEHPSCPNPGHECANPKRWHPSRRCNNRPHEPIEPDQRPADVMDRSDRCVVRRSSAATSIFKRRPSTASGPPNQQHQT